eukprot:2678816-Pyramimonas_sp.AAC.2
MRPLAGRWSAPSFIPQPFSPSPLAAPCSFDHPATTLALSPLPSVSPSQLGGSAVDRGRAPRNALSLEPSLPSTG